MNNKTTIIAIVVIAVLIVAWVMAKMKAERAAYDSKLLAMATAAPTGGGGGVADDIPSTNGGGSDDGGTLITESQQQVLRNLAVRLHQDIYDTPWCWTLMKTCHTIEYYNQANALSDTDLVWMAQYYRNNVATSSLYNDLKSESFISVYSPIQERLLNRLVQNGQY